MTIEEKLKKLEELLEEIDVEELSHYLDENPMDDNERITFSLKYMYTQKHGIIIGLVPILDVMLEYCPVDAIGADNIRKRLSTTDVEKKVAKCKANIEKVSADIAKVDAENAKLLAKMDELRKKEDELRRRQDTGKEYRKRLEELNLIVESLDKTKLALDKEADQPAGALFDREDLLENYERFLSACLKGREMVLPDREGSDTFESEKARVIHEFMLIKWYLNQKRKDAPPFDEEEFLKRFADLLKRMDLLTEEGKQFFKDYMDATQPEVSNM